MEVEPSGEESELVVVIAPTPRDGQVTCRILTDAGLDCEVADDPAELQRQLEQGVGALVVTDITLAQEAWVEALQRIEQQPSWSNLPVLALCRDAARSAAVARALRTLRNVILLDRPVTTQALVSATRAALRGRRWQYQIRDQIDRLVEAEHALRKADRRKDEFLATLAHELRNPLAPITTGLEVLARSATDSSQFVHASAMMSRQLAHLVRLIDELLEVSRISTGKLVLHPARVDLRQVVASALEGCQPLIERSRHRMSVSVPEHELAVSGDSTRLTQALSNLINNAAKYTPDGGRIEVTLAVRGDMAVLSVADDGMGLPPDMLERVFEMFAQVNHTLERAQGGLGIGLALVRSVVALHGGEVKAESAGPGQGSRFTITLALAEAGAVDEGRADVQAALPDPVRRHRILVVDDNQDAADSLAMLLELDGHDVRVEHAAETALDTAAAFQPHAIFCDLGMPGMGGLEFASRLRQDTEFAETLLVAVTGWGAAEDQRRSRGAGFDAHLTKPASVDSVASVLARL